MNPYITTSIFVTVHWEMCPVWCGKERANWNKMRKTGVFFSREHIHWLHKCGIKFCLQKWAKSSKHSGTNMSLSESRIWATRSSRSIFLRLNPAIVVEDVLLLYASWKSQPTVWFTNFMLPKPYENLINLWCTKILLVKKKWSQKRVCSVSF